MEDFEEAKQESAAGLSMAMVVAMVGKQAHGISAHGCMIRFALDISYMRSHVTVEEGAL